MFELFYWPSIVRAASQLPKEAIIGAVGAYVILDMHKTSTNAKIEVARAEVRKAELKVEELALEVEALKMKKEMSENPS